MFSMTREKIFPLVLFSVYYNSQYEYISHNQYQTYTFKLSELYIISELIYYIRDSNNVLKSKIIDENNLQMNKKLPFMNLNLKEKSNYIPVENLCLEGK